MAEDSTGGSSCGYQPTAGRINPLRLGMSQRFRRGRVTRGGGVLVVVEASFGSLRSGLGRGSRSLRPIAVVACLVLVPRAGSAQTAIIEGRVTVAPAGRAAAVAEVRIEGTPLVAVTDTAGHYRIGPVPPGPQVLVVRKIGYAPARLPLTVPASGVLTQDVTLAASALTLPDIVVTADPASRATGEVATASVIDREAIAAQSAVSIQGARRTNGPSRTGSPPPSSSMRTGSWGTSRSRRSKASSHGCRRPCSMARSTCGHGTPPRPRRCSAPSPSARRSLPARHCSRGPTWRVSRHRGPRCRRFRERVGGSGSGRWRSG